MNLYSWTVFLVNRNKSMKHTGKMVKNVKKKLQLQKK